VRKLSTIRAPQALPCGSIWAVTKGQQVSNNNSHISGVK
jgi:hypothetical protein